MLSSEMILGIVSAVAWVGFGWSLLHIGYLEKRMKMLLEMVDDALPIMKSLAEKNRKLRDELDAMIVKLEQKEQ